MSIKVLLAIPKVLHTAALLVPASSAVKTASSFSASIITGRPKILSVGYWEDSAMTRKWLGYAESGKQDVWKVSSDRHFVRL